MEDRENGENVKKKYSKTGKIKFKTKNILKIKMFINFVSFF